MKLYIYSVYDKCAEIFNKPFTEVNDNTAIRAFKTSCNQQPHKDDYVLYKLGVLDDVAGTIKTQDSPQKLLGGIEVKVEAEILPMAVQDQAV